MAIDWAEPAPSLSVEHVSRWYGNVVAVNDISFDLRPGITGLLGPNGAGKSTLLHMLAGLLKPSSGEAKVMGETAWKNPAIYRLLGLVPEREAVYDFLTGSISSGSAPACMSYRMSMPPLNGHSRKLSLQTCRTGQPAATRKG